MSRGHVRHVRWLAVAMTVAAAGLGACGDDGGNAKRAAKTTSEKIVIKLHADLQDVAYGGEVLRGSSLGGAPFCQGGRFTGEHGNSAMIDRKYRCQDAILRIGFSA